MHVLLPHLAHTHPTYTHIRMNPRTHEHIQTERVRGAEIVPVLPPRSTNHTHIHIQKHIHMHAHTHTRTDKHTDTEMGQG